MFGRASAHEERFWPLAGRFLSAIATDRPWSSVAARVSTFFVLAAAGTLGGALSGWTLHYSTLMRDLPDGDALIWDSIEFFGWIGLALGAAVGLAASTTRGLLLRILGSAFLGLLGVTMAVETYSRAWPRYLWGSNSVSQDLPVREAIAWGLFLGVPASIALALIVHMARRLAGKPLWSLLVLPELVFLGLRSEAFFWDRWNGGLGAPCGCGMGMLKVEPLWASLILSMVVLAGTSILNMSDLWVRKRGGTTACFAAWSWAAFATGVSLLLVLPSFMPFTSPSESVYLGPGPGNTLVTGHLGGTVRVWEAGPSQPGQLVAFREVRKIRVSRSRVTEYAAASGILAWSETRDCIKLTELAEPGKRVTVESTRSSFQSFNLSPDGRMLAAVDDGETLRLWDVTPSGKGRGLTLQERTPLGEGTNPTGPLAFSGDGTRLACGSEEGIQLWCLWPNKSVTHVETGSLDCVSLGVSAGGLWVVEPFPAEPGGAASPRSPWHWSESNIHWTHVRMERELRWAPCPDGRHVATAASDGLRIWDRPDGLRMWIPLTLTQTIALGPMAWSADGKLLAVCSQGGVLGVRPWE